MQRVLAYTKSWKTGDLVRLMPKMDGMVMMNKLRETDWGKTVPVIILTNLTPNTDSTLNAVVKNHPVYYLLKANMSLTDIVEKAREVLKIA